MKIGLLSNSFQEVYNLHKMQKSIIERYTCIKDQQEKGFNEIDTSQSKIDQTSQPN
jgi:hypothetical protein